MVWTTEETVKIEPGTPADKETVYRFLTANFFPYEPICQSIGVPRPQSVDSVNSLKGLDKGTVLLARESNSDRLVGVAICFEHSSTQGAELPGGSTPVTDPESQSKRQIFRDIFGELDQKGMKVAGDSWPENGTVLHLHIICTAADQRGKGVGKQLAKAVIDLGRKRNAAVVTAHCTGPTSQHVLCSAGFRKLCAVSYEHLPNAKPGACVAYVLIDL